MRRRQTVQGRGRAVARAVPASSTRAADLAVEERADRLRMRLAATLAVLVHAVFFSVTIPALELRAPLPDPVREPVRLTDIEWVRPEPPPTPVVPEPEVRRVPVPDPTPEEPEPIRSWPIDEPPVVATPGLGALPTEIPAPPEPWTEILRFGGDMTKPVRISGVQPSYTQAALRVGLEGTVILEATIDREGRVIDIRVVKDLPLGLTERAVEAVRTWQFEPSTLGGQPVAVYYHLSIHFRRR